MSRDYNIDNIEENRRVNPLGYGHPDEDELMRALRKMKEQKFSCEDVDEPSNGGISLEAVQRLHKCQNR